MLVVEFNTPRNESSSATGMHSRKTEKSGEPPSTVDFEEELPPCAFRQAAQFPVAVDHGALVGRDGMHSHLQRLAHVSQCRLAGGMIHR